MTNRSLSQADLRDHTTAVLRVANAAIGFMDAYDKWWSDDQGADGVWDDRTVKAFSDLSSAIVECRRAR